MLVTINFNHFYRCHIVYLYHILEKQVLTIFPFNFSLTWDIEIWNEARFQRRVHFCERKSVRRILCCFSDGFEQYSYVCFPSKFLPKFLYTTSFPIPGEFSHAASSATTESTFLDKEKYLRKSGKVPANQEYTIEYLIFALSCVINVVED